MTDMDTRLSAAISTVLVEIGRTDSKASALLTGVGVPLAVLVAVVPGQALPPLSLVLVYAGGLGLVAAMLAVLLVVRPSITSAPRGSYLYWATCTPEAVTADLSELRDQAAHLVRLSKLARRKYSGLRAAIDIMCAALLALAAALVALFV